MSDQEFFCFTKKFGEKKTFKKSKSRACTESFFFDWYTTCNGKPPGTASASGKSTRAQKTGTVTKTSYSFPGWNPENAGVRSPRGFTQAVPRFGFYIKRKKERSKGLSSYGGGDSRVGLCAASRNTFLKR